MKLFIILMSLSTLGFGVAAAVLYTLERNYGETLLVEKRALERFQQDARNPDNKQYHTKGKTQEGTAGRELPEYLSQCARLSAITGNIEGIDAKTEPKSGYFETRSTYRLKGIAISDLVRFLARVEGGKDDVHLKRLVLSRFDYTVDVPTCSAQADFYVFSEKE
jgi:hypothetical protein